MKIKFLKIVKTINMEKFVKYLSVLFAGYYFTDQKVNIYVTALIIFLIRFRHKIISICKNSCLSIFENNNDDMILFEGL